MELWNLIKAETKSTKENQREVPKFSPQKNLQDEGVLFETKMIMSCHIQHNINQLRLPKNGNDLVRFSNLDSDKVGKLEILGMWKSQPFRPQGPGVLSMTSLQGNRYLGTSFFSKNAWLVEDVSCGCIDILSKKWHCKLFLLLLVLPGKTSIDQIWGKHECF